MKVPVKVVVTALGFSLAGWGCGGLYGPIIDDGVPGGGYGARGGTSVDAASAAGGRGGHGGSPIGADCGVPGGPPPTDELVAYYNFNEGAGTALIDGSPNGNHGTLLEGTQRDASKILAAPNWVDGKKGKAYKFDGVNDWAFVPPSPSLDSLGDQDLTPGMSAAAWVKFSSLKGFEPGAHPFNFVVSRQQSFSPGNEHFGLGLFGGHPMGNTAFFFTTAPDPIVLNSWTHIAMTYDGIEVRVYVNGELAATQITGVAIAPDTTPLIIGANENFGGILKEFADAAVDEIFLYSRPLTDVEVKNVMNAGL